jgi:hypothetical protein
MRLFNEDYSIFSLEFPRIRPGDEGLYANKIVRKGLQGCSARKERKLARVLY